MSYNLHYCVYTLTSSHIWGFFCSCTYQRNMNIGWDWDHSIESIKHYHFHEQSCWLFSFAVKSIKHPEAPHIQPCSPQNFTHSLAPGIHLRQTGWKEQIIHVPFLAYRRKALNLTSWRLQSSPESVHRSIKNYTQIVIYLFLQFKINKRLMWQRTSNWENIRLYVKLKHTETRQNRVLPIRQKGDDIMHRI